MLTGLHSERLVTTPPTNHHVFSVKTSFLTISFDNTIAVVANVSKQLSVMRGEKQTVSNTATRLMSHEIMQHNAALAAFIMAHTTCCVQKKNMQTSTGYTGTFPGSTSTTLGGVITLTF